MIKYIVIIFFLIHSQSIYAQNITTEVITNLSYSSIPQYELPKQYLIDNHSTLYPKENAFRRADIIFFLSLPITMFIMQNILNFINILNVVLDNYNTNLGRDNFGFTRGEWYYLIAALTMIPTGVMIYDAIYVQQYPVIPFFSQDTIKESRVNLNIYRVKF